MLNFLMDGVKPAFLERKKGWSHTVLVSLWNSTDRPGAAAKNQSLVLEASGCGTL